MANKLLFSILISIIGLGLASVVSASDSSMPATDHSLSVESTPDDIEFDYSPRTDDMTTTNVAPANRSDEIIDFDYTPRNALESSGSASPDIECAFADLDTLPQNQASFCRLSMGVN